MSHFMVHKRLVAILKLTTKKEREIGRNRQKNSETDKNQPKFCSNLINFFRKKTTQNNYQLN